MAGRAGFDNDKHIAEQASRIGERMKRFAGRLYLEFGGKVRAGCGSTYGADAMRLIDDLGERDLSDAAGFRKLGIKLAADSAYGSKRLFAE